MKTPAEISEHRLRERDEEFRQRLMELDLAGAGIAPAGITPQAPAWGAREFADSLQDVDVTAAVAVVTQIHRQGYAIVPDFLGDRLPELRGGMAPFFESTARLFRSADRTTFGSKQTVHVQNVLAKSDIADGVACDPLLRTIVAGVLGYDFLLHAGAVAMSPDPGCDPQGMHRDDGFFARLPRPHMPLVLTASIALDDFSRDNGGTELVPHSMEWPPEREPEAEDIVYAEMPAGSMLLWDGALFHSGGANRSQRSRRTLTLTYTRGWLRTHFNQYLSVPRARVLAMPATLQADLGYRRSALGLGVCDMQDPLDYLQRLQQAGGDGQQHLLGREVQTAEDNPVDSGATEAGAPE